MAYEDTDLDPKAQRIAGRYLVARGYFAPGDYRYFSCMQSKVCSVSTNLAEKEPFVRVSARNINQSQKNEFVLAVKSLPTLCARLRAADNPTWPKGCVVSTITHYGDMETRASPNVLSMEMDTSTPMGTNSSPSIRDRSLSTDGSWGNTSDDLLVRMKQSTIETGSVPTTDWKTWNCGSNGTPRDNEWKTVLGGPDKSLVNMSTSSQRVVARYLVARGYFSPGDYVFYGKWKNKPGKLTRMFVDERGVPMVEIEPIPLGRKKPKTMSLFKFWRVTDPDNLAKFQQLEIEGKR